MNVSRMFRKYFSPEKTAGAISRLPAFKPRGQVLPLIVRKWFALVQRHNLPSKDEDPRNTHHFCLRVDCISSS
ncbi:hypothetical protein TNCV_273111 [Trichonephila clavipes]|nr:hypothetical protein TNCV_273111 [Trichonephila clavipes]